MSKQAIIVIALLVITPILLILAFTGLCAYTVNQEIAQLKSRTNKSVQAAFASNVVGTYTGTLGIQKLPVFTEFTLSPKGELKGRYRSFEQKGEWYDGELAQPSQEGTRTINFIWHDKFGTGPAHFEFNDQYTSFHATWSSSDADLSTKDAVSWMTGTWNWDGERQK